MSLTGLCFVNILVSFHYKNTVEKSFENMILLLWIVLTSESVYLPDTQQLSQRSSDVIDQVNRYGKCVRHKL